MLKYALIGCGRISINHIRAALNNQLEIVAVCDIVTEHMVQALEKAGQDKIKILNFIQIIKK